MKIIFSKIQKKENYFDKNQKKIERKSSYNPLYKNAKYFDDNCMKKINLQYIFK